MEITREQLRQVYISGRDNGLGKSERNFNDVWNALNNDNSSPDIQNIIICTDESDCECERKHGYPQQGCVRIKQIKKS